MCFFTEAQQRAFDAIQQRRAQAAAQAVQVSGFNPYAPPVACAAPTSSAATSASVASTTTDDATAAKVAHAFANTSPQFVTRFIQEVVQQQLQQAASQAAPFSMAHHPLNDAPASSAAVTPMQQQDSVKRSMDESMSGEPMIKRQKYTAAAMPPSAVALMNASDDAGSSSDSEKRGKKQKRRFVWTADLRDLFDRAVASMEPELVGPKNIYKYMSRLAPAMVRDSEINTQHIKSHLQKWRIARRRGLPMSLDCKDDSPMMSMPSMPPMPQQPSHSAAPQQPQHSEHQFSSSEIPSSSCASTFAYQTPTSSVSISPESAVVPAHPPNPSFQSPPAPVPKPIDLEPPLLLDDFDQSCDPLLSSWDSLFSDSPAEDSLVPAAASAGDAPADGDMLMPPVPSDVLAELSKAVGGSNAGLSTSEILKYMMLGYQLGYQNCFTELTPENEVAENGAVVSGNTASSLSLF